MRDGTCMLPYSRRPNVSDCKDARLFYSLALANNTTLVRAPMLSTLQTLSDELRYSLDRLSRHIPCISTRNTSSQFTLAARVTRLCAAPNLRGPYHHRASRHTHSCGRTSETIQSTRSDVRPVPPLHRSPDRSPKSPAFCALVATRTSRPRDMPYEDSSLALASFLQPMLCSWCSEHAPRRPKRTRTPTPLSPLRTLMWQGRGGGHGRAAAPL
ncbi:hypothetical protein BC628DRAFT_67197 [Trametes gibbosa]|nr:hypothetical protein BC628DRAFT_67197 [Trametes gibbosa]